MGIVLCRHMLNVTLKRVSNLGLSGVLVFGQVDPGDGAKRSEKLLQVSLTGVLGQVGHTDSRIVIGCGGGGGRGGGVELQSLA